MISNQYDIIETIPENIDKYGNESLGTGDIILCDSRSWTPIGIMDAIIRYFTKSNITHVGMILKNPSYINSNLKDGLYVWESSYNGSPDPQDGCIKLGVQITPIDKFLEQYKKAKLFTRKVVFTNQDKYNECFNYRNIIQVHDVVYKKPYDIYPQDWIEALTKKDPKPQKEDRFWCSALVGYIYTKCGLLNEHTDWSILAPANFTEEKQCLLLKPYIELGEQTPFIH